MARPINAALFVSVFTPTGNSGEYTIDSAVYNNQADRTGNGTYDVQVGFALYVPSTDLNTGMPIPGAVHRYKLTAVTPIDPMTLSCTILWDEPGVEGLEIPTNGVGCLLAETSSQQKLGFLPSDLVYPELTPGTTLESSLVDTWNIVDQISGGSTSAKFKATFGDASETEFVITHSLGTLDIQVQVFEIATGTTVYCGIARPDLNSVTLSFTEAPPLNGCRVLVTAL